MSRGWLLIPDFCMILFAAWTLAANLAYAMEASLCVATILFAAFSTVFLGIFLKLRDSEVDSSDTAEASRKSFGRAPHVALLFLAVALVLGWLLTRLFILFWAGCLLISVIAAVMARRKTEPYSIQDADGYPAHGWILWTLALAGAFIALVACRPNWDDSMYLNRSAVVAADFFAPMTHYYTMFKESDHIPFPYPTFPLIAFHDFVGLLSWITNWEPLEVSAFLVCPFGAILVVLAYGKMARVIFGKIWIWAFVAMFVLLVTDGTAWDQIFSGYAFTRIWQGKSLMLHLCIPLLIANGLLYGARGGWRALFLLAATQTASVGFSSLGIWVAPFMAGISVFIGALSGRCLFKRLSLGALASFYPVFLGLFAMTTTVSLLDHFFTPPILENVYLEYFGSEKIVIVWGAAMLLAGVIGPSPRVRLFCSIGVAAVLLTFSNPLLAQYFARYVTSGLVFYRMMWLLPLPVVGAALFCSGLQTRSRFIGIAVFVALIQAYIFTVPEVYALEGNGRVSIGLPSVKVRESTWDVAKFLMANLPQNSAVVASETMGYILPTVRKPLHLVTLRRIVVTDTLHSQLKREDEFKRLMSLLLFTSSRMTLDPAFLEEVINHYDVKAFVMDGPPRMTNIFGSMGFRLFVFKGFTVFVRDAAPLLQDDFESWRHEVPDGWRSVNPVTAEIADDSSMGIVLSTSQNSVFRELSAPAPLADCFVAIECNVKASPTARARIELEAPGRKILSREHPQDGEWHTLTSSLQFPHAYGGKVFMVRLSTLGDKPEDVCSFDNFKCTVWKSARKTIPPPPRKAAPFAAKTGEPQEEENQ